MADDRTTVFDPAKDAVNRAKHGVSLALAAQMTAGEVITFSDRRFDNSEILNVTSGAIRCVSRNPLRYCRERLLPAKAISNSAVRC
ncbi:BrnT family toxin [Roseospira goensis]|uniref:Uncharacterized DUF497 family protein n=1 Tax=Roseospira goensis TaxID=391922 RepID=A0A7W6WLC1_9PROT|nr:BrnT family toxin [Roseospira goensis]MBB4286980.1 uncharacterized DUF497 family protein [Roseospira goensis]